MAVQTLFILGVALTFGIPLAIWLLFRAVTAFVEDGTALLVERFGKHVKTVDKPGLVFLIDRMAPWVKTTVVSLKLDHRMIQGIQAHDRQGTTTMIDLFVETRIVSPAASQYAIVDRDKALKSMIIHATMAAVGVRPFEEVMTDRNALATAIRDELSDDCSRWGIEIGKIYVHRLGLMTEAQRLATERVVTQVEQAHVLIEERGRLMVDDVEADSHAKVAHMEALAASQFPKYVGDALHLAGASDALKEAYSELYRLSLLRPDQVVVFRGFAPGQLSTQDAAMLLGEKMHADKSNHHVTETFLQ